MEPAKPTRLEAGTETTVADDQLAADAEAAATPDVEENPDEMSADTAQIEGEEGTVSYSGDEAINVDEEDVVDVAGDAKQTGISVRGGMDAGGEVKANNDA